ncbi:DUF1643 domain-containing protein [Bacillaceae bacterium S4-13-58]
MQEKSQSGILLNKTFRDSLIIDKYDIELHRWREKKLEQVRSENSEDAMTWNVFKSLKQINPSYWLPHLFKQSFHQDFTYPLEFIDVTLWKKINPPLNLPTKEGQSEIDVIIETNNFVWIIEVKYKSDISLGTTHDKSRNQIIRNIDVGLDYSNGKDFYFSLLILDEAHSPQGFHNMNVYTYSRDLVKGDLTHRNGNLLSLRGIGLLMWSDILYLFDYIKGTTDSEFERVVAEQAELWLRNKIDKFIKPKNGAIFDETGKYRYSLTRVWAPMREKVVFVGLNPSTADEKNNDPTLKRCIDFAKRWHNGIYGSLEMVNLFSYRSTDFEELKNDLNNDQVGRKNDDFIFIAIRDASLVIVAWGEKGTYKNRDKEVLKLLNEAEVPIYCLEILKGGQPKHPLYAKGDLNPVLYVE